MTQETRIDLIDNILTALGLGKADPAALLGRFSVPLETAPGVSVPPVIPPSVNPKSIIWDIPPEGLLINQPGTYTVTDDITWNAATGAGAAITIDAPAGSVTLDMADHSIKAVITDRSQPVSGIYVKNTADVTIRNGMLLDMCKYGIRAENVTGLAVENVTVSGMVFRNIEERLLSPSGIFVNWASNVKIIGCAVQYMYVTSDSCAAFQLRSTTGAELTGCTAAHITNYDGAVMGFGYFLSSLVKTSGCTSERLQSCFNGNILTGGHTVLGFMPCLSSSMSFEDCTATGITGSCDDCHGMSLFVVSDMTVTGFSADGVTDGPAPYFTGAKATGLEVYGCDITLTDCQVSNITAYNPQDLQATGFSNWGSKISLTNCTASNVQVLNADGSPKTDGVYADGFGWAPDPRPMFSHGPASEVTYSNCTANNCQNGFDTWYHRNSSWTGVIANGCTDTFLQQPGGQRTLTANPASECNPPVSVTLTNIAADNTGLPT